MKTFKLLWVEDDHNDLDPILFPLKHAGVLVEPCSSLEGALERISHGIEQYNAILIDLILPKTDDEHDTRTWQERTPYQNINFNAHLLGVELIRFIRQAVSKTIPIVVLSVVNDPEISKVLGEFSVKDFLYKSPNVTNKAVCKALMEAMES